MGHRCKCSAAHECGGPRICEASTANHSGLGRGPGYQAWIARSIEEFDSMSRALESHQRIPSGSVTVSCEFPNTNIRKSWTLLLLRTTYRILLLAPSPRRPGPAWLPHLAVLTPSQHTMPWTPDTHPSKQLSEDRTVLLPFDSWGDRLGACPRKGRSWDSNLGFQLQNIPTEARSPVKVGRGEAQRSWWPPCQAETISSRITACQVRGQQWPCLPAFGRALVCVSCLYQAPGQDVFTLGC